MRDERSDEATVRLAASVASIHPERRWARSLDGAPMTQRCDIGNWRALIGFDERAHGEDVSAIGEYAILLDARRLVISGHDTGIGKTSIAVAMMFYMLDEARDAWVTETPCADEKMHFAAGSRFVAAIDLARPNVLRDAERASLLVLDDVGREGECGGFDADRARATVANLLDRRERSTRMRTIVTTYLDHSSWQRDYGGRIARLWWEMQTATVLEVRKKV
jgi:DNA replication protein DnaC